MAKTDDIVWTIKVPKQMDDAVNKMIDMLGYRNKAELTREAIREFILHKNLFTLFGKDLEVPVISGMNPEEALKEITKILARIPKDELDKDIKAAREEIATTFLDES